MPNKISIPPRSKRNRSSGHIVGALLCSASLTVGASNLAPVSAMAAEKNYSVDLPAQPLAVSLKSFAKLVGAQIIYPYEKLQNLEARQLVGSVSVKEGLRHLLTGTELAFQINNSNVIVITASRKRRIVAGLSAVSEAAGRKVIAQSTPSASRAQNPSGGAAAAEEFQIEEIIVTATKRARRLQDVPMAISAVGEKQLERLGADGFEGYYRTIPGLSFNQGDASRGTFSIRGINTSTGIAENQAPVAIYVDELPTDDSRGGRTTQDLNLFDVERVEVLRGPQGTLFGSGALGGAIRIITNKPDTREFAAKFEGGIASAKDGDATYSAKGMVNIPVVEDKFAIRAVGFYKDTGGFVDNAATGEDNVNTAKAWGGRVAAKLKVSDDFALTATVSHQEVDTAESAALNELTDTGFVRANALDDFSETQLTLYNLKMDYDMGFADLMSSTTYSDKETVLQQGIPGGFPIIPGVLELDILAGGPDVSDSFAQELRLTSSADGPLRWVLGAFYFKRNRDAVTVFELPGISGFFGTPDDIFLDAKIKLEDKETALYGEVSYDISDKFEATVGLRWFNNDASYSDTQVGIATGYETLTNNPDDHSENQVTPRFVLSYKPNDDVLVYASAAKGYRIGGTNVPIPAPSVPSSFGPDSLWNYELGFKSSWFDNRLIFNLAYYYIDWSDIQVELDEPTTDLTYTTNAGQAHSSGVEVELIARPTERLQLTSSFAWNEAEMNEDVLNPDTGVPFAVDGDKMPGARDFTISNAAEYNYPISSELNLFVRADHQYVGKGFAALLNAPSVALAPELDSYTLVNARIGLSTDAWEVTLYADNLFDTDRISSLNGNGTVAFRLKPRTVGINLRTQF